MKKSLVTVLFLLIGLVHHAQKDHVLLTINNQPILTSEFQRIYEKNLDQIDESEKDIDRNLTLFINYKLKLLEAYRLQLDTSKTYKSELRSYRNQLMTPYLQDNDLKAQLVKEAYDRTVEEVRASHILISYSQKTAKRDSLEIIQLLDSINTELKNGVSFEALARKYSDDPSAKVNGGDLGYFSAFRMVYPFEEAAYKTKVGDVSDPFKTRFGYHILKVTDKRKSKGAFEAAHILARDRSIAGKVKIDSIYEQLVNGTSFETLAKKYSEDKGSAPNGGVLPKFSSGRMVPEFENAVFNLKEEGAISKPFQTQYGWHIVKLIKNYPVRSFEEMKPELEMRIRTSPRGNLSTQKLIKELKERYSIQRNDEFINQLKANRDFEFSEVQKSTAILTIEKQHAPLREFLNYINNKRYLSIDQLLKKFEDQEVLEYYKEDLVNIYPEFKHTLQEYKDGLLLFDLMKTKIWDISQNDDEGLQAYFEKNKSKYQSKDFSKIKGEVMNDYQNHLEQKWLVELRERYPVTIHKKALKKLKKSYNQ